VKKSVLRAFFDWNVPMEGYLTFMYLDVKRLVTTGVGNLVDPIDYAEVLPWRKLDGTLASVSEVRSAWNKVKNDKTLNELNGGAQYGALTQLRLSRQDVEVLVRRKLLANDSVMRDRFKDYESWPADAQLGVLSLAWAAGPRFAFPKLEAAAAKKDFRGMADECSLKNNPKRSKAQKQLFLNAAKVVANGLCQECLLGYEKQATAA